MLNILRYKSERNIFFLFFATLCIAALMFPWTRSFSLDETLTAWVISGSTYEIFSRTYHYQATTPLYFFLLYALNHQTYSSEWFLRLPSFLAFLGTLAALFCFSRRFFARTSQAALLFACFSSPLISAAFQARPYMPGVFCGIFSLFLFSRWIASLRFSQLFLAACFYVLAFYFHYTLGLVVFAHLALFISARKKKVFPVLFCASLIVAAAIPVFSHLLEISEKASAYQIAQVPSIASFLLVLFPAQLSCLLLMALILTVINRGLPKFIESRPVLFFPGLALWFGIPLFVVSLHVFLGIELWSARYMVLSNIGAALLIGSLVHSIGDEHQKRFFVTVFAALILFAELLRVWVPEDWKGAVGFLNDQQNDNPALVYSGLSENDDPRWIENSGTWSYLMAPVGIYPLMRPGIPVGVASDLSTALESDPNYLIAYHVRRPGSAGTWNFADEVLCERLKVLGRSCKKIWPESGKTHLVTVYGIERD